MFWAIKNDSLAHSAGSIFFARSYTYLPYLSIIDEAVFFISVMFCKFIGLTKLYESFWILNAPASQKEWKFDEVPFSKTK